MDWFLQLFTGTTIAHAILIYSLVIAIGVILGKVKFFGVSLGTTFVLFVGILVGHFQLGLAAESKDVLDFIREFGLILFIFSIGMQVGPGFFASFKEGGLVLNGLAILIVTLNIAVALSIYGIFNIEPTAIVGILSGAVTNTPGLGAAQQALIEVGKDGNAANLSMGYAAAYPLGVVGIILSMIVIKAVFRVRLEEENRQLEEEKEDSALKPHIITIKVTNKLIDNMEVGRLSEIINRNFVISRLKKADSDEIIIPTSKTLIHDGDLMMLVITEQEEQVFTSMLGPRVKMEIQLDAEDESSPVVSRRIVVTNSHYVGRKIGSLRLHMGYQLNATRVNRAGVDLIASPNLALQIGDRITVVGKLDDINRLAERMGNSMRRLNEPNMFTMFIGILLGIIVGSFPIMFPGMTVPMKLGLAGGPLVVAILISRFGHKVKLVTYTSSSANLLLRELGICLFLASVGIAAGDKFAETVFSVRGAMWVAFGFAITFIPLIIVGAIGRGKFKLNYCTLMGLISGSTTDPPALAYANKTANNDAPAVAYSTVYPLTMFLRVITAQILILALS